MSKPSLKLHKSTSFHTPKKREACGHLRVRCVSAQLPTADVPKIFRPWTTVQPYGLVYIEDSQTKEQSSFRRTRTSNGSKPQWKEEFWFAVRNRIDNLALNVEIYDDASDDNDMLIGRSCLMLDDGLLARATHKRLTRKLELKIDTGSLALGLPGSVGSLRIEIGWEPLLELTSAASARAMLWVLARSPFVLRTVGVTLLGLACLLLLIAQQARWICSGPSLPLCKGVEVPGLASCALLAALCAGSAGGVHFLGSMGLFGSAWDCWDGRQPTLLELAEADIEGDEEGRQMGAQEEDTRPTLQLQVHSSGVLGWNISVGTSLLPRVHWPFMRLVFGLAHLASLTLAQLALALAWLNDGRAMFLGEAEYLSLAAVASLMTAALVLWREGRLMREQVDRWHQRSLSTPDFFNSRASGARGIFPGGGGGDNPLEQIAQSAGTKLKTQIQRFSREAETARSRFQEMNRGLAQPLLDEARGRLQDLTTTQPWVDAGQRLQERLDELNTPLIEARQRLQHRLDELNIVQPLQEARQRIQEHLEVTHRDGNSSGTPDWMQPILDALNVSQNGLSVSTIRVGNQTTRIRRPEVEPRSPSSASPSPARRTVSGGSPERAAPAQERRPDFEAEQPEPILHQAVRSEVLEDGSLGRLTVTRYCCY